MPTPETLPIVMPAIVPGLLAPLVSMSLFSVNAAPLLWVPAVCEAEGEEAWLLTVTVVWPVVSEESSSL